VLDRLAPRQSRYLIIESLAMNSPDAAELKCAWETALAGHLSGKCLRNAQQLGCGRNRQSDGCGRHRLPLFFAGFRLAEMRVIRIAGGVVELYGLGAMGFE